MIKGMIRKVGTQRVLIKKRFRSFHINLPLFNLQLFNYDPEAEPPKAIYEFTHKTKLDRLGKYKTHKPPKSFVKECQEYCDTINIELVK